MEVDSNLQLLLQLSYPIALARVVSGALTLQLQTLLIRYQVASSDNGGACSFPWELGPMAAAASMNHVAGNRIDQLQGFAVALLLWFPCILAGVDSKNVNLSKEECTSISPFRD